MTPQPSEALAAFVGLDWAEAKHAIGGQASRSAHREFLRLDHRPEAIDAGAQSLRTRFTGQPSAVCLELKKGPSGSALRPEAFLGLFPVHPRTVATYREALTPSRANDDPTAAELQVARLLKHRAQLTPLVPHSPPLRALAPRVAQRRRLVGDNVRLTNRVTSALKHYFPHVLQGVQAKDTAIVGDCLRRWPTLKAVPLARRATRERFFRAPHVRPADVLTTRIAAIKHAVALTTAAGVITPHTLLVQALVAQLRVPLHAIADFDTAIAQPAQAHPDFPWFDAWPGAGAVLAPRLLVAFGEHRARVPAAEALQTSAGRAPVTERRGKQSWVHWRGQCPTFLRQTCVEWAAASLRHSFWAHVYAQQPRDTGTSHHAAVRALAFQWIPSLLRCWHDRTPYEASTYLQALHRRGSSLIQNLAKSS